MHESFLRFLRFLRFLLANAGTRCYLTKSGQEIKLAVTLNYLFMVVVVLSLSLRERLWVEKSGHNYFFAFKSGQIRCSCENTGKVFAVFSAGGHCIQLKLLHVTFLVSFFIVLSTNQHYIEHVSKNTIAISITFCVGLSVTFSKKQLSK